MSKGHVRFRNWTIRILKTETLTAEDLFIKANSHFHHGITRRTIEFVLRSDHRFEAKGKKLVRNNGHKNNIPIWGLRHEHCICGKCGAKLEQELK